MGALRDFLQVTMQTADFLPEGSVFFRITLKSLLSYPPVHNAVILICRNQMLIFRLSIGKFKSWLNT